MLRLFAGPRSGGLRACRRANAYVDTTPLATAKIDHRARWQLEPCLRLRACNLKLVCQRDQTRTARDIAGGAMAALRARQWRWGRRGKTIGVHWILFTLLLVTCNALPSLECLHKAADLPWYRCRESVCEQLGTGQQTSFLQNLSPACRNVMLEYRTADRSTFGFLMPRKGKCMSLQHQGQVFRLGNARMSVAASRPTNPVVVEAPGIKNFVLCTVPKSGCTHFRKLLNAIIHNPEADGNTDVNGTAEVVHAHFGRFPTIWHYEHDHLPADLYPSFIIGRNPYVRLLSGYLDKMVHQSPFTTKVMMLRYSACSA
jgi:hypothetical protein